MKVSELIFLNGDIGELEWSGTMKGFNLLRDREYLRGRRLRRQYVSHADRKRWNMLVPDNKRVYFVKTGTPEYAEISGKSNVTAVSNDPVTYSNFAEVLSGATMGGRTENEIVIRKGIYIITGNKPGQTASHYICPGNGFEKLTIRGEYGEKVVFKLKDNYFDPGVEGFVSIFGVGFQGTISDIIIDGNCQNNQGTVVGVEATGNGVVLDNVEIINCDIGVNVKGNSVQVRDCIFRDCGAGVVIPENSSEGAIENSYFVECGKAMQVEGNGCLVAGNIVYGGGGFSSEGGQNITFLGNDFYGKEPQIGEGTRGIVVTVPEEPFI